jgi:hypothetical protein
MRERGITFLLALAALGAFYAIWLRPAPSFDAGAEAARPTSAERRGNGYAGLFAWLESSGVTVRSFRDRYTQLAELDVPPRGNLLVISLPGIEPFHNDEFAALDKWVRRGNTLLINVALADQPGWAAGRESSALVELESLTALEFETKQARAERLDDKPLSEKVRQKDAEDAKSKDDEGSTAAAARARAAAAEARRAVEKPERIALTPTGPHPLLSGVHALTLDTDYAPDDWALRMPYDNFVLTLARTPSGEGALFEQRHGAGRIIVSAAGTLFANRALGLTDNARLFSNIVSNTVGPGGAVLFDDLRQGLSANYDPARFYKDPRLFKTLFIVLGLWFAWVLGSTRLRASAIEMHDPSEAELVRRAGGLIARTVAPWQAALRLFDHFFARVARAARGDATRVPERGELWQWLERHAAILPQELDQLKNWYADAHSERKLPLVPLQNLLDSLEKRLKT